MGDTKRQKTTKLSPSAGLVSQLQLHVWDSQRQPLRRTCLLSQPGRSKTPQPTSGHTKTEALIF